MQPKEYSAEEIKDIQGREAKALETLKELNLTPAAKVFSVNIGEDVFAQKVVAYLGDTKYATVPVETPKAE